MPSVCMPSSRIRSRPPHLRTWRDGWRHLRFLLALSPRWLMLYPGLVLLILGGAGLVWLSFGTFTIGDVSFSVQTMLACATAAVAGIQTIGLAVVARSYASDLKLLPVQVGLERALERVTLERGVLIGALSTLLGVSAFVVAVALWGSTGFGTLDVAFSMRLPIWGMVLVISGLQVFLVSFTLSLTRIESR